MASWRGSYLPRMRLPLPRTLAVLTTAAMLTSACSNPSASDPSVEPTLQLERLEPAEPDDVADLPVTVLSATDDEEWFTTGFLEFPVEWTEPDEMTAGFSVYVAAWPLQETYPGPAYQTGLPSTWLVPSNLDGVPGDNYSTIEGGLGWWNDTRFPTETPKFIMGGVARDFSEWANGPGAGAGTADVDRRDWDVPQGKYGVAQLSPHVLWAPDGLNLEEGTNGELFGYGYHPLPLLDAQVDDETGVTTGDQSWTLFLHTENFRGPVSFFVPNFFSKPALTEPSLEGRFFDTSPMDSARVAAMETQVIPSAHAIDAAGNHWARITPTLFPATDTDSSVLVHRLAAYAPAAVRDPVAAWLSDGGTPPASPPADATRFSRFDAVDPADTSTWTIIFEGIDETEEYPIDWTALATVDTSDPLTFRYRWNTDVVERRVDGFALPEFYRLADSPDGSRWHPVPAADVPTETGLLDHTFAELGTRNELGAFTTPTEPNSPWTTPGPVTEPTRVELGDGSTITYAWYRFVDQPAIRHWNFPEEHLDELQRRVEALHREWGDDYAALAAPSVGRLARLDPAIVVEPPAGLEVGYVPIVTRQERTE